MDADLRVVVQAHGRGGAVGDPFLQPHGEQPVTADEGGADGEQGGESDHRETFRGAREARTHGGLSQGGGGGCRGARPCPQSRGVVGLFVVRRHELTDESWAVIGPL
ncbi:hypothetical protein ACFWNK_38215, partial [Streptomyces sp. NPDC058417]|uniref:hypothetical protein n=1 Tax=Streptomyces sp. NPDC058417 TaxID=3346487 RepID=UPI003647461D